MPTETVVQPTQSQSAPNAVDQPTQKPGTAGSVPPRPHKDRPPDISEHLAVAGRQSKPIQHVSPDGTTSPIVKHGPLPRVRPMTVPPFRPVEEHAVDLVDRFLPRFLLRGYHAARHIPGRIDKFFRVFMQKLND